ncbi:MAG: hypothetical protein HY659_15390 [Rhizobiales bacterium]|nr:hypothetical protein [Hyphomicrobiales bacterium]
MRMLRRHCVAATAVLAALIASNAAAQDQTGIKALTEAYNASGQELYRAFAAEPGNIVFSPYSIGTAMAMARTGARSETEQEMVIALKHRQSRTEIDAANADVLRILNAYDTSAQPPICPSGMRLNDKRCETTPLEGGHCPPTMRREGEVCSGGATIAPSAKLLTANALMLAKRGDLISTDYASLLKDQYAAEIFKKADLGVVNGWVKTKTEGKIDKILEKLDPDAVAVILNAVYFKARWDQTFDIALTRDEAFHLTKEREVKVPTMHGTSRYAFATRNGYRAIRLPYAVRKLGMVIVLPNELAGAGAVARALDQNALLELFGELRKPTNETLIELSLPRFKTSYGAELVPQFKNAGMKLAFDDRNADFSGMTGRPPSEGGVYIDGIVHRAIIEVSEETTEAAASTAIVMMPTRAARPEQPQQFRVDRPFLFYVVDDATGAILFQGRIVDPR